MLEGVKITGKAIDVVVGLYPLLEPHSELSLRSVTFCKLSSVCEEGDFLIQRWSLGGLYLHELVSFCDSFRLSHL
jgi:hypothetical protein